MKKTLIIVAVALATPAMAELLDGANWADEVLDYSAAIQNYDGFLMNENTEWWLLGEPDCDVDGNGYAWNPLDQDTVAGWRTTDVGEYVVLYWEAGLPDRSGDDLSVVLYGGPFAEAELSASVDGVVYGVIGAIGGGTPGYLREETFDFAGLFDTCVHYVRLLRVASGPQTGMFFDAFGGNVYWGDFDGDCDVDLRDFAMMQACFRDDDGEMPGTACELGDFDGDGDLDIADWLLFADEITGPAE
ncbi:MAG: hypothetical protein JXB13_07100 [Phycisphaerae bacterium]|nr:hypothetical protein [Phycisphaerae bacterium]